MPSGLVVPRVRKPAAAPATLLQRVILLRQADSPAVRALGIDEQSAYRAMGAAVRWHRGPRSW